MSQHLRCNTTIVQERHYTPYVRMCMHVRQSPSDWVRLVQLMVNLCTWYTRMIPLPFIGTHDNWSAPPAPYVRTYLPTYMHSDWPNTYSLTVWYDITPHTHTHAHTRTHAHTLPRPHVRSYSTHPHPHTMHLHTPTPILTDTHTHPLCN